MLELEERRKPSRDEANTIKSQETIFPFLKLPAELRILVYEALLSSNHQPVTTWRGTWCGPCRYSWIYRTIHPAILRTCRLVHQEAAAVLYGRNFFRFGDTQGLLNYGASFTKHIGPYNASLIRILTAETYFASEARHIAQTTLAVEASLAAETSLAAATLPPLGTTYINKSRIAAIVATFGIDLAQLRKFAIRLWPCSEREFDFDWKAAGIEDPTEQSVKIPNADIERAVDRIVEREKGWLRGDCFEWETRWGDERWVLYEINRDD